MLRRLRTLTERECYARCYGGGDDAVRVLEVAREPVVDGPLLVSPAARVRAAVPAHLSGEELRRLFEERLDRREPRAA